MSNNISKIPHTIKIKTIVIPMFLAISILINCFLMFKYLKLNKSIDSYAGQVIITTQTYLRLALEDIRSSEAETNNSIRKEYWIKAAEKLYNISELTTFYEPYFYKQDNSNYDSKGRFYFFSYKSVLEHWGDPITGNDNIPSQSAIVAIRKDIENTYDKFSKLTVTNLNRDYMNSIFDQLIQESSLETYRKTK